MKDKGAMKITLADIKAAGLTISKDDISKDDILKAKNNIISKGMPMENGGIETTRENC